MNTITGPYKTLTGKRFGQLVVLGLHNRLPPGIYEWKCRCDCGETITARGGNLKSGHVQSCGCLQKLRASQSQKSHGSSNTREYAIWSGLKRRCLCPNDPAYANYGGRGITVSPEWETSFETFFADMGKRPVGATIERKDNNLGYRKDNCIWATRKEQNRNRRDTRRVEHDGELLCVAEWAERLNLPYKVLHARLFRYRWTVSRAFSTPKRAY